MQSKSVNKKMMKEKTKNAVNAILEVYQKSIADLQFSIKTISQQDLVKIIDLQTSDPDCKSIQTILAHVVSSGYSYSIYIQNSRGFNIQRPEKILRDSVNEYIDDLNRVIDFTQETFIEIYDFELETFENANKIKTSWQQYYDIEQIMEHAIVHVLRHKRQIEKFKILL